jgi:hypothetical protein
MIREMGRDALAEAPLALDITNHTPFAGDDSRTTGKVSGRGVKPKYFRIRR